MTAWTLLVGLAWANPQTRYDVSEFGKAVKTHAQSLGTPEANVAGNPRYEPLRKFPSGSRFRDLGRAVGMLDLEVTPRGNGIPYNTTCTATLIAPDRILTNHHCVPGLNGGRVGRAQLRLGFLDITSSDVGETFEVSVAPLETNKDLDYSILAVERVPTTSYPPLPVRPGTPADGQLLYLLHHPGAATLRLTRVGCFANEPWSNAQGEYIHQCDTIGGSSGALLLDQDFRVVGVHRRGYLAGGYNIGTPIQALLEASPELRRLQRVPDPDPPPAGGDLTHPVLGTLRKIRGGRFTMGSNDGYEDEKPPHEVRVSSFYLMESEVTQGMWTEVMGSNPSEFAGCRECPVEHVSWKDAVSFAKKLSGGGVTYRLPTEAEWEYAARGGESYRYAGSNDLDSVGWYDDNSESKTHPVCQKKRNGFELCDMSGNVLEWVGDWDGPYSGRSQTDPTGPSDGSRRVNRGGGWYDSAGTARVALRYGDGPGLRDRDLGFRLARSTP